MNMHLNIHEYTDVYSIGISSSHYDSPPSTTHYAPCYAL